MKLIISHILDSSIRKDSQQSSTVTLKESWQTLSLDDIRSSCKDSKPSTWESQDKVGRVD